MYAYKEKDKKSDKQYQPTSHLSSLINQLTLDMSNKTIPCGIKNPKGLLQSLLRLQNIVGMHSLKENIAKQTSYLIQKMATNDFNMNMLNTTLYGNPGTGKTTVGVLLAEIWHHLGFLQTATNKNINIYNLLNTVQFELLQVYIMVGTVVIIKLYNDILLPFYQNYGLYTTILLISLSIIVCYYICMTYLNNKEDNEPIVITSRSTFVDLYMGGTANKTEKFLQNNLGKVIFIDEAYSLYNGHHDLYGGEALDSLNRFMSEHANEIVVIFAGYQDKLEQSIFKVQPGLNRRCMWKFDCCDYNGEELYEIFKLQLKKEKQQLDYKDINKIKKYFVKHEKDFVNNGGDSERLVFYTILNKNINTNDITYDDIKLGFKELRQVNLKLNDKPDPLDNIKKYLNI